MMARVIISTARFAPLNGQGRFDPVESSAAGREMNKDAADAKRVLAG
jgi:hypothetical protein